MAQLVDVHGSCVSRNAFNLIDSSHIKVNHNLSRNHIVSCMMPPCNLSFAHGELVYHQSEYAERCMTYALNKKTLNVLLESEADWLVIDFFDFCQPVAGYQDTTFSTYDYTFYNTAAYKENKNDILVIDFLALPHCLWYEYVNLYFQKVVEKYRGNIILNRLNCADFFLSQDHRILKIPERLLAFGNAKYNQELAKLEEYVIQNFPSIYIVDISKYFIPDYTYNPDTTPVHYEENYNICLSYIYRNILSGSAPHYNDLIPAAVVADIMNRPISTQDFREVWQDRAVPFCSNTVLDYVFRRQSDSNLFANRKWIALLYQEYHNIQAEDSEQDCREITKKLLSCDRIWNQSKNDLQTAVYQNLFEIMGYLSIPVPDLYHDFLRNFEEAMPEKWIVQLNLLSIIAPDYELVPNYLVEYYQTIHDDHSLLKFLVNHL